MKKENNVKVFALGGLGEVGKNMYVIEQNDEIIIIDSGILFPEDNFGVDYIIPDYTYLKENEKKIIGLFITHGHEDHIGGIPYLLREVKIPIIFACGLAVGLIRNKLSKFANLRVTIEEFNKNSIYTFNNFEISFFRTNHSIPDSYGIAIKTIYGYILHTGDFKFDFTPIAEHTEYSKITNYSEKGIALLLSDSTNAGVSNFAPSERKISQNINTIFSKIKGRVIISTFASNVYRVQQIVEASVRAGRKVIVFGRSMEKTINVGQQLRYIKAPEGTFINVNEFPHLPPEKITILSTGSQGEPLAALSRIAEGTHKHIKIIPNDTIVFSSSATVSHSSVCSAFCISSIARRCAASRSRCASACAGSFHAIFPSSFFNKCPRAVLNSSPIMPSLNSQVRKVYFSFGLCVFDRDALFCFRAWSFIARHSWIYDFTSPAWRVELNSRNSTVPFVKTLCKLSAR